MFPVMAKKPVFYNRRLIGVKCIKIECCLECPHYEFFDGHHILGDDVEVCENEEVEDFIIDAPCSIDKRCPLEDYK